MTFLYNAGNVPAERLKKTLTKTFPENRPKVCGGIINLFLGNRKKKQKKAAQLICPPVLEAPPYKGMRFCNIAKVSFVMIDLFQPGVMFKGEGG
ncbi:unnamed protein product [Pieris brassicae]|uniref:Uncharacterized protein n=1 Tax=Pieris brassicae TaxID=7116 RepID=A0A9P0TTC4_PIEBR|nr:unnamed protein product [Pieris brassicae]